MLSITAFAVMKHLADVKILVIEDEPELNQLSVESLRAAGHDVWSALSLTEAWTAFEQLSFKVDLIIADKRLPDGNGADFAMRIRREYPNVRMAMVSGFLTSAEKQSLEAENIRCYAKPALYRKVAEDARIPPCVKKPVIPLKVEAPVPPAPPPPPVAPEPPPAPVAGERKGIFRSLLGR